MFRVPVLLFALSLLFAVPAGAGELVLVDAGQSAHAIVTPARPAPAEQFAAAELQRYLQIMTGARLPVLREAPGGPARFISIGATTAARAAGAVPRPRYAEDDGFEIRAAGGRLFLAGVRPRGTLFAVYEFLRGQGCRWFAPGYKFYRQFHQAAPRKNRVAVDAALRAAVQPAFRLRGEYPEHYYAHDPDDVLALLDWSAKNGINLVGFRQNEFSETWYRILQPECEKRDLMCASAGHGYDRFLPRDRYFREHPEWYALIDGRRSDRYFDQFCTSNPDALAAFRQNLADFVRKFPRLDYISAMPNDSPRWCTCEQCQKEGLSSRDRLLKMTQLVSKTVYEANPRMKIEVSAGVEYFGVAANEVMTTPYPNVTYRTGVLRRCLRHAWNDPACALNRGQYETAREVTAKITSQGMNIIWTSRYSSFREHSLPGILYPQQMAAELQDLAKLGGSGVLYNYAILPDWMTYELKHYLYARLLVDPSTGVDEFLHAYFRERFPGSPDAMEAFYTALRRAMERYDHPGGGYTREDMFGLYPPGEFQNGLRDMEEAQGNIDRAMAENANPDQRQLLWLWNASLQYGKAKLEIDRLAQTGRRDEAVAKAMALMDYIETWQGRGIFYDSVFLRRAVEYRFAEPSRDRLIKKRPWSWVRMYEFKDFLREK
jgi:hypothetical protein